MKYQARYNTGLQLFLTQFLIYLYDNKEATYESFSETLNITPQLFSKYIPIFNDMITNLEMNVVFSKYTYQDNKIDTSRLKTNVYLLTTLGEDKYHFSYSNLTEEQLIQYSMTILYLMLKQHKYIKHDKLVNIFPNLRRDTLLKMIDMLQSILIDEISKNEINSYILINE